MLTATLNLKSGQELKLVYPQDLAMPERFSGLQFDYFFLQPMDGPLVSQNTDAAIEYCKENPQWRLSIQMHKLVGLPWGNFVSTESRCPQKNVA